MASTFFGLNIAVSGMNTYNAVHQHNSTQYIKYKNSRIFKAVVNQQAKKALSLKNIFWNAGNRCRSY